MDNPDSWLLTGLNERSWWRALLELERALGAGDSAVVGAYMRLYRGLVEENADSVPAALAGELLYGPMAATAERLRSGSLLSALQLDVERLSGLAASDWQQLASGHASGPLPPLSGLVKRVPPLVSELAGLLRTGGAGADWLNATYERQGQGRLAEGLAWQFSGSGLELIERPARDEFAGLHGLDEQLAQLKQAVQPWLGGRASLNVLLYGPRGSGKSTAARALLTAFSGRGLRLIQVPPAELIRLPGLLDELAHSPLKFVLFVDDLSFGRHDSAWRQFKSLLDGTLQEQPGNVMLLATSNRRQLLTQRFGDRPDPLDEDVHAWDTQDEQLAFSDRFGLVITFPAADQRRYLELVRRLARERGMDGDGLSEAALLFARRGNGMSGRTARHFVDSLVGS